MRINATSIASLVQSAQTLSAKQVSISQQLSSGVRITALSDDAAAAGRSAQLSSSLSQTDAFLQSATTVGSRLQASDTALASVVSQLTTAVALAVQGANDTQSTANRSAIAAQLSGIQDSVKSLANSSYAGSYLFAGSASTTKPFVTAANGTITYAGDSNVSQLRLTNGDTVAAGIAGGAVFTDASNSVFSALQSLITTLTSGNGPSTTQVSNLRDSLSNVITQRSILGTATARIDTEKTYATSQQTNSKTEQSALLASDPVSLATQLSAAETQRSALLSTLAIVQKGSLFDYI